MYPASQQVLTEIIENYEQELLAFIQQQLPTAEPAEDLLQEVWLSLARTLDTQQIANPRAWLYRAVRNRLTDLYRSRQVRAGIVPLLPEVDAADTTIESDFSDSDEVWDEIMDAVDSLPKLQREVFVRNTLEGETLREIAEYMGIPLKTAISRKGYARRRLQDLLEDTYDNFFSDD